MKALMNFEPMSPFSCYFMQVDDKLDVITLYLRTKHKYCIWCGTKYEGKLRLDKYQSPELCVKKLE